jgi:hypothetical protein
MRDQRRYPLEGRLLFDQLAQLADLGFVVR